MSDPLDILTRLVDAKVAAVKGTVARSKQIAVRAKQDLDAHERWLQRHRVLAAEDLKRHQGRLQRRRAIRACEQAAISLVLLVPFHGATRVLICLGNLLSVSDAWAGAKAHALGVWLAGVLSMGCSWIGAKAHALAVWLVGVLSMCCTSIGAKARDFGVWLADRLSLGFSWGGERGRAFGLWLIDLMASCLSWIRRVTQALSASLIDLFLQVSQHFVQAEDAARDNARDKVGATLDGHRLREAAFIRLRAQHEGLQHRIHAMSQVDGRRVVHGGLSGGASSQDRVQLHALAHNARRLFETQQRGVLDRAQSSGRFAPNRLTGHTPSIGLAETRGRPPASLPAPSARAQIIYGPAHSAPIRVAERAVTGSRNPPARTQDPLTVKLQIGSAWSYARGHLWHRWRALQGGVFMEHRAILPGLCVFAVALVLAVIGSQAPAADPPGIAAKDDGSGSALVMADVADEARISVVAKSPESAPPPRSESAPANPGFSMTAASLEPLPSLAITVPSLMVMANFSPVAAVAEQVAMPRPVAALPRAETRKPKAKPAVPEAPVQSSWLRPSWLRMPWSAVRDEAEIGLGLQSGR